MTDLSAPGVDHVLDYACPVLIATGSWPVNETCGCSDPPPRLDTLFKYMIHVPTVKG